MPVLAKNGIKRPKINKKIHGYRDPRYKHENPITIGWYQIKWDGIISNEINFHEII